MAHGYLDVIILTFLGFCLLAAILLIPVYRFLKREEVEGEAFTEAVRRHSEANRDGTSGDGTRP